MSSLLRQKEPVVDSLTDAIHQIRSQFIHTNWHARTSPTHTAPSVVFHFLRETAPFEFWVKLQLQRGSHKDDYSKVNQTRWEGRTPPVWNNSWMIKHDTQQGSKNWKAKNNYSRIIYMVNNKGIGIVKKTFYNYMLCRMRNRCK